MRFSLFAIVKPSLRRRVWLYCAAALCAGCRREQIAVYDIPKGADHPRMMASMPEEHGATAQPMAKPQLQWKTPAGWQERPPTGMSAANFSIKGEAGKKGDMSVMGFPGANASEIDLINIVRGEAGLPAIGEEEFSKLVERVDVGSDKGMLIDFTGATTSSSNVVPNRIMLTVLRHGGIMWFFKFAGDSQVLAAQKPALLEFLKSVSFVEGPSSGSSARQFTSSNEPQTNNGIAATTEPATAGAPSRPAWQIPTGWHETAASQMLLAKFATGGQDGQVEITVSSFPGEVGGLLANVNRWRGQIGLPPIGQDELGKTTSSVDVPGGKATLVEMSGQTAGSSKGTSLVGVIWPREGQTWFYKMMGDSTVAGREKDAFVKFVQSVRFPNG